MFTQFNQLQEVAITQIKTLYPSFKESEIKNVLYLIDEKTDFEICFYLSDSNLVVMEASKKIEGFVSEAGIQALNSLNYDSVLTTYSYAKKEERYTCRIVTELLNILTQSSCAEALNSLKEAYLKGSNLLMPHMM